MGDAEDKSTVDGVDHARRPGPRRALGDGGMASRCGRTNPQRPAVRFDHAAHVSTRQYARLVDEWVTGIGLRHEYYGTHSLRRTKASLIY